jgi:hypothetical protein
MRRRAGHDHESVTGGRPEPRAACFLGERVRAHAPAEPPSKRVHERSRPLAAFAAGRGSPAQASGGQRSAKFLHHHPVDVAPAAVRQEHRNAE